MRSIVARVAEDSPFTKANRDSWNATSKEYQARHHAELEGDVLWGPSMPPERELKILGESVRGQDRPGNRMWRRSVRGPSREDGRPRDGDRLLPSAARSHPRSRASKKVAIRFHETNAQDLSPLDDASFDIAFSAYALG